MTTAFRTPTPFLAKAACEIRLFHLTDPSTALAESMAFPTATSVREAREILKRIQKQLEIPTNRMVYCNLEEPTSLESGFGSSQLGAITVTLWRSKGG